MQFYGKAEESAKRILALFESGDVPQALQPIFIRKPSADIPCRKWSWNNQLLAILYGHDDARGFRQWQEVGRHVLKGEKAFHILCPCTKRVEDKKTGETKMIVVGFKGQAVFGYSQTDGQELPYVAHERRILDALPFKAVAEEWGLKLETYNGRQGLAEGKYAYNDQRGVAIRLGVENASVFCHELMHAADHRLGNLTENGRYWRSEIVAELGACVLLSMIGCDVEADPGGAWKYIQHYANQAVIEPIAACQRVLKRVCDGVAMILAESDRIAGNADERQVA